MSDLIDRIKGLRYVHVPKASQLFEEAIAEIERLRLTDEEREAVEWFANYGYSPDGVPGRMPPPCAACWSGWDDTEHAGSAAAPPSAASAGYA